jgi:hypothetical protein
MVARIKWIDRKFNFDNPVGMFPYILERLRGAPVRIEEIIKPLDENTLNAKINGEWSIKEHIGHIADLEELHEKRLSQLLEHAKVLIAADMSNQKTDLAEHNKFSIENLIKNLRETRRRFVSHMEDLDEGQVLASALHPRLNVQMRIIDLAFFAAEHDDHHITIIREIAETNK